MTLPEKNDTWQGLDSQFSNKEGCILHFIFNNVFNFILNDQSLAINESPDSDIAIRYAQIE